MLGSGMLLAGTNQMKRYDVKSGKIDFKIIKSGDIMGMMQTKTIGKKRLIFDHFGIRDMVEVSEVTKDTTAGKSKVSKVHTLTYMNGGILYHVKFKKKKIVRMKNPALAASVLFGGGKSIEQSGKSMMKKMGGKMIGKDKVLGYTCEVWDLMGVQQCIYKGITLRVMSDIMGVKSTEVATKITFDVALGKADFKLPDFPITDKYGKMIQVDKSNLDALDTKQSAKATQEASDAAKAMAAGLKALVSSGADLKSGKDLTPKQEQAMEKAMMAAMGGEKGIVAKQKQKMLKALAKMPQAKTCFSKAGNVTQANACEKAIDSEDPKYHTYWSKKEKAEILREIEVFESAAPCIRAAQSFSALKQCMPR